jgi:hypothetical protein
LTVDLEENAGSPRRAVLVLSVTMAAKEKKNEFALRITDQQRTKRGMAYDLKGDGARLTVYISPRENPEDPGDWRVEVSTRDSPSEELVLGWGTKRADALHEASRAWMSRAAAMNLPTFDWDQVAKVLGTVRAL